MNKKLLTALIAIATLGSVSAATPPKKTVSALLTQYEAYYGVPLDFISATKEKKSMLTIPNYDRIFNEEYPDFIMHNNLEAIRLDSAYNSIVVSNLDPRTIISECDRIISTSNGLSPNFSSSKRQVVFTTTIEGRNSQGQEVVLYGDKKKNLVAVLDKKNEDGDWEVLENFESIDMPYYTLPYRRHAVSFSGVNVVLKKLDALRTNYSEMIADDEKRNAERLERERQQAAALLEHQLRIFTPDAAVREANEFLRAQGHSVGNPRGIINHGPQKVVVFADDFSRFKSSRSAVESQLPTLRRTLTQTKEMQRYSPASQETLKKNVRTLIQQHDRNARAYRNALVRKVERDIVVVTYTAGLTGTVTLYANPDGSLNYLTWKDSAGGIHTEYPSIHDTMQTYEELANIIDELKKFSTANP